AKGQRRPVSVGKGVHLLLDDVCLRADAPGKERGEFEDGDTDFLIPITECPAPRRIFDETPPRGLLRKDIFDAFDALDRVHRIHQLSRKIRDYSDGSTASQRRPSRMLKQSPFSPARPRRAETRLFPCIVLASFRSSTDLTRSRSCLGSLGWAGEKSDASGLRSLRPCPRNGASWRAGLGG